MNYGPEHIFPTTGAAGAIAHAVRAVTEPGDEVVVFAPYFPEYGPYITGAGLKLKVVPADTKSFQINFDAFLEILNEKVMAVLVNTPNNPSGIAYSTETLTRLSSILKEKSAEYGHTIFLLSDEPYREIVFDGKAAPCISAFYDNTIMCYSFSKSLSLPGDRIGYMAVNPAAEGADLIVNMAVQVSRGIGHNCPTALMQRAVAENIDLTADLSVYEKNSDILYRELTRMGFSIVKPGGTFYMFPKAPIEDAGEFCNKALEYGLVIVPGDSFACKGYFRIAYCVPTETVERSIPQFEKLAAFYGLGGK
jgi:aspartate aminotransferase